VREFVVFSRRGCHLCEEMLEQLEPLCRGRARVVTQDVDTREDWRAAYGDYVPVLVADDTEVCRFKLDRAAVLTLLESSSK